MKRSILSLSVDPLLVALSLSMALFSCQPDPEDEPIMAAGPSETKFSLVDSLKVSDAFKTSHAQAYTNLNGKTYQLQSANQAEVFFLEENNQVTLYFKETSTAKEQPWVAITLKNHTVHTLPAVVKATDSSMVCVETGQSFADGTSALSPGCETVSGGALRLSYNPATDKLSGSVTNLQYPVEYFVPSYALS